MAEFSAMPLWTDAYLGDTTHLTTLEHGAYLLLLITMWRAKDQSLPDDDKLLARYTKLTAGQWKRIRPIIEEFFEVENGRWMQGRLTDEANAVRQLSKRQSKIAKARWLKNKETDDATAMPRECREDAPITHNPYPPNISDSSVSKDTSESLSVSREKIAPLFEEFWDKYPDYGGDGKSGAAYKGSKSKASEKFFKICKDLKKKGQERNVRTIIQKAGEYNAYCQACDERCCHAVTWLNQKRWETDYSFSKGKAADTSVKLTGKHGKPSYSDALDAAGDEAKKILEVD